MHHVTFYNQLVDLGPLSSHLVFLSSLSHHGGIAYIPRFVLHRNFQNFDHTKKRDNMAGVKVKRDWITIPDDFEGYSLDLFNIPSHYRNTLENGQWIFWG